MIYAGVSKVCITPPVGTWQGGYGARTSPAQGVHDDLYARAIVLRGGGGSSLESAVAIVSVDVVGLQRDLADGARRRAAELTGIPAQNIALCCSHTHGGPIFRPFVGREGPQPDADYLLLLEKYLAGAVAAAARDLRPVALRLGRGEAHFNVNRRLKTAEGLMMRPNPEGPVDHETLVLRVDEVDTSGSARGSSPLAVLFRFSCHATAMGANNYLLTADYPGAAAAHIEGAYREATTALFLQGCAGDIRPHLKSATGGFTGADWTILDRLGRELGAAVVSGAERTLLVDPTGAADGPVAVASETVTLPYDDYPGKASADEGMPAEVQVLRLGPFCVVTLPGEVFVEIGWRVRDAVAEQLGIAPSRVIVTAYANGSIGYLPTAAAVQEGGYETTAYQHQGRPAGYVPHAEDLLVQTAAQVAARVR